MSHDVVGVAGELHGRAVQLRGLLSLHEGGLHVGGAVGHVEGERVVAGRGAALGGLAESGSAVRKPNLAGIKYLLMFGGDVCTLTCILASLSLVRWLSSSLV